MELGYAGCNKIMSTNKEKNTIKLGYNDLSYNEFASKTYIFFSYLILNFTT